MARKSKAEIKRQERREKNRISQANRTERLRAAGYRQMSIWVRPDQRRIVQAAMAMMETEGGTKCLLDALRSVVAGQMQ